jgi:hypothetical protein
MIAKLNDTPPPQNEEDLDPTGITDEALDHWTNVVDKEDERHAKAKVGTSSMRPMRCCVFGAHTCRPLPPPVRKKITSWQQRSLLTLPSGRESNKRTRKSNQHKSPRESNQLPRDESNQIPRDGNQIPRARRLGSQFTCVNGLG